MIKCSESNNEGKHLLCCERCYHQSSWTKSPPEKYFHQCPIGGPGTELKKILRELGITSRLGCGCGQMISKMNAWGVVGCIQHFEELRKHLVVAQAKLSWSESMTTTLFGLMKGFVVRVNPLDVPGSLLRLAISRAEQNE